MAICTKHFMYCDGDDCPLDGHQAFPDEGLGTKRDLWRHAWLRGWTRKKGKHYCPECSRPKASNTSLTGGEAVRLKR